MKFNEETRKFDEVKILNAINNYGDTPLAGAKLKHL